MMVLLRLAGLRVTHITPLSVQTRVSGLKSPRGGLSFQDLYGQVGGEETQAEVRTSGEGFCLAAGDVGSEKGILVLTFREAKDIGPPRNLQAQLLIDKSPQFLKGTLSVVDFEAWERGDTVRVLDDQDPARVVLDDGRDSLHAASIHHQN